MLLWSRGKKVNKCPPSTKNWTVLLGQPLFLILAAIHIVLMEDVQLSWYFRQPLINFLVNTLRKQSLELDGNWLCFIKEGREGEREFTIRLPIAFLKKKGIVKLGQGRICHSCISFTSWENRAEMAKSWSIINISLMKTCRIPKVKSSSFLAGQGLCINKDSKCKWSWKQVGRIFSALGSGQCCCLWIDWWYISEFE